MKIHIKKDKIEKKGFFGGGKSWFSVGAHYELNDEERRLLEKNKNVLGMTAFDFPFRGPNGDPAGSQSPTVKNMTGGKEYPIGCVFTNGELQALEDLINEGAKNLKAELFAGGAGSTSTEI
jgi:hypothetical protein